MEVLKFIFRYGRPEEGGKHSSLDGRVSEGSAMLVATQ